MHEHLSGQRAALTAKAIRGADVIGGEQHRAFGQRAHTVGEIMHEAGEVGGKLRADGIRQRLVDHGQKVGRLHRRGFADIDVATFSAVRPFRLVAIAHAIDQDGAAGSSKLHLPGGVVRTFRRAGEEAARVGEHAAIAEGRERRVVHRQVAIGGGYVDLRVGEWRTVLATQALNIANADDLEFARGPPVLRAAVVGLAPEDKFGDGRGERVGRNPLRGRVRKNGDARNSWRRDRSVEGGRRASSE